MTTWKDLDLSSSKDEDKEANICSMENTTSDDEAHEEELLSNSLTLSIGYKELKKKISKLSKEFDYLKNENDIL
ncbi:hypothetical protein CR513_53556, partial [Mucuna pruriens]